VITPAERRRYRWFLGVCVAIQLPILLFVLGAGRWSLPVTAFAVGLVPFATALWVWKGLGWVRRDRAPALPANLTGWRRLHALVVSYMLAAILILLGFSNIVINRGPSTTLRGQLLAFFCLWVPLALLIGLPAGRLNLYRLERMNEKHRSQSDAGMEQNLKQL
jgi:hypothetical protein